MISVGSLSWSTLMMIEVTIVSTKKAYLSFRLSEPIGSEQG